MGELFLGEISFMGRGTDGRSRGLRNTEENEGDPGSSTAGSTRLE